MDPRGGCTRRSAVAGRRPRHPVCHAMKKAPAQAHGAGSRSGVRSYTCAGPCIAELQSCALACTTMTSGLRLASRLPDAPPPPKSRGSASASARHPRQLHSSTYLETPAVSPSNARALSESTRSARDSPGRPVIARAIDDVVRPDTLRTRLPGRSPAPERAALRHVTDRVGHRRRAQPARPGPGGSNPPRWGRAGERTAISDRGSGCRRQRAGTPAPQRSRCGHLPRARIVAG
jgi:hypothetical protein